MHDAQITLRDGRRLAFTEIGDLDGRCVFFFHGAPLSRLSLIDLEDEFARTGLRVVSADRPGYGSSSPQPGRSLADWPQDVAALADVLGIETFSVVGHSSGGPYAVACSALLPSRVCAGAVIAGVTDFVWPGAWKQYIPDEIEIMRLPDEDAAVDWCIKRYGADGSGWIAQPFELPQPDSAMLANARNGEVLMSAVMEAFRQGVGGYAQDIYVQGRAWPFTASGISTRIQVIHGEQDTLVPIRHSRHTSELIRGSTFRVFAGHGHLTILSELPKIASELAPPV